MSPDPSQSLGNSLAHGDPTLSALRREVRNVRADVPLGPYCAYRVGGPAQYLAEAHDDAELRSALSIARDLGLPVTVLGQATNVLVDDRGVPGLVLMARNSGWRVDDDVLSIGSGAVLAQVIADLAEQALGGLEFAGNIPGSVGGAVVGNAGAYGRCVADVIIDTGLIMADGRMVTVTPDDLEFGYRASVLKHGRQPTQVDDGALATRLDGAVVLGARFRLTPGSRSALLAEIARDAELRRAKHPLEYASCGSYFKNPSPDRPAARYIEETGLKGLTMGRARVSEQHANFLVALDGASAADILTLAAEVKRRVREDHGVELEEEVVRLGGA